MINASELRIGNLVTDEFYGSFKTIIKVESINDKGINLAIEDDGNYPECASRWIEPYYKFNELYGIPLTEELILKIKNDVKVNHMKDQLLFSIDDVSYYLKDGIVEVFTTHQSEPTTTVSSFHELQNVHFALRKKELVI
jgi:hypothetical protein